MSSSSPQPASLASSAALTPCDAPASVFLLASAAILALSLRASFSSSVVVAGVCVATEAAVSTPSFRLNSIAAVHASFALCLLLCTSSLFSSLCRSVFLSTSMSSSSPQPASLASSAALTPCDAPASVFLLASAAILALSLRASFSSSVAL
eukprot:CAMPEP_0171145322 /NCGR_PEP_ID=MMETSP0766_2-20121228/147002_1 /TAXON_ID=439317 /ORGANISM="Gambierdiscus australes, Strain CAWD 149" /LENGTH=150 /DNA_ID=CAMNT_0011609225 /DNA_START=759 /DNA_END=1211 /DNA_ORIENTATION=+